MYNKMIIFKENEYHLFSMLTPFSDVCGLQTNFIQQIDTSQREGAFCAFSRAAESRKRELADFDANRRAVEVLTLFFIFLFYFFSIPFIIFALLFSPS